MIWFVDLLPSPSFLILTLISKTMTNSTIIHKSLGALLTAVIVVTCVFIMGIFIPTLVSSVIAIISDKVTFIDCFETPGFWIISILGWIISSIYLSEVI